MPIGGEIIPECVNLPEKQETCLELGVSGEYLSHYLISNPNHIRPYAVTSKSA